MCNAIKSLLKCGLQLVITICNFVLLAAGIVLVVAGSIFLYKAKNEDPSGEEGTTVETSVIIALGTITALGALLAIIGFCGCCGTLCRNPCMLKTYAIIQLIIFLGVAAGLIFVLLWNNGLDDEWPRQVKEDYGQIESVTEIWDSRMTRFQCCGDDSYEDWRFSYYARTTNFSVPETCCKVDPETGNYTDLEKCREEGTMFDLEEYEAFHLNVEGCDYLISKSESVIIGISSFLLVFQLLSMILACMLVKDKSKTDQIA